MKNRQLINERQQLMKIAGLLKEARMPSYGGTDTIPDFEFQANGKDYIAKITVDFNYDWDSEDGISNYQQTVSVHTLGVAQGDEYFDVTDQNEIASIENLLNTDGALSSQIENLVDINDAEEASEDTDEYFDDDLEEDSDYDMGTPSGDTNAMGDTDAVNIGETKAMYSYSSVNDLEDAVVLVDELIDYMNNRADSVDEPDETGHYSMNEEGQLGAGLEDLKWFLKGLQKGKQ